MHLASYGPLERMTYHSKRRFAFAIFKDLADAVRAKEASDVAPLILCHRKLIIKCTSLLLSFLPSIVPRPGLTWISSSQMVNKCPREPMLLPLIISRQHTNVARSKSMGCAVGHSRNRSRLTGQSLNVGSQFSTTLVFHTLSCCDCKWLPTNSQ